jgi:hypothetical protein
VRIHTACEHNGIPAFSVYGALTDHHRLIWQFGVVPLMYYLYGENVIIDVREDPLMGSAELSTTNFKSHQPVDRRTYAMITKFHLALVIPMAVTETVPIDPMQA